MKIKKFDEINEESKYDAEDHINTIVSYLEEINRNINRITESERLQEIEIDLSNIIYQYNLLDVNEANSYFPELCVDEILKKEKKQKR
jgi:hypothetical protein